MWLYLICFIAFPLVILIQIKKVPCITAKEWLSKERTDAIRGVAILLVVLHHVTTIVVNDLPYTMPFVQMGFGSVSLFFLMSGYAHMASYGSKELDYKFLWKKFKRMLVPYFLIWIIYFVTCFIRNKQVNPSECLADVLHLAYPGTPCWYFKVQLLLYVIFFVAFGIIMKKANPKKKAIVATICILIYMAVAYYAGLEEYWYLTVIFFSIGLALGIYSEQVFSVLKKYGMLLLLLALLMFIVIQAGVFFIGFKGFYYPIQILLCILLNIICISAIVRFRVGSIVLKFMANISLELYLIHGVMLSSDAFPVWNFVEGFDIFVYLFIAIILSWIIHVISNKINIYLKY